MAANGATLGEGTSAQMPLRGEGSTVTGVDVADATDSGTSSGSSSSRAAADASPPAAPESGAAPLRTPRWRDRISTTLDVIRANPTGRIALKVFIGLAGLLVVAVGAALIPLPGPGWLIVLGGLGIWAVEFSWARRLLNFTRRNLQMWTRWVTRQSWAVRILLGLVGMIFVGGVVWLSVWLSFDLNLVTSFLDYIATH
jgi:uncharacterized protein (TIGR02611 family)